MGRARQPGEPRRGPGAHPRGRSGSGERGYGSSGWFHMPKLAVILFAGYILDADRRVIGAGVTVLGTRAQGHALQPSLTTLPCEVRCQSLRTNYSPASRIDSVQ